MSAPIFDPCLEILPQAQQEALGVLKSVARHGFVLYDGTAIALQLGHRESVDFDFFTHSHFTADALQATFPFLADAAVLQQAPDTLSALLTMPSGEVQTSFLGGLSFGRVGVPQWTRDGALLVASPHDLLGLKLAVILKRVEVKDYRDIAALLRAGFKLDEGLAAARLFYPQFPLTEALRALTYFEGGDLSALSACDRTTLIEATQSTGPLPLICLRSNTLTDTPPPCVSAPEQPR
ncbi:MAG: nucleotidyl transferase AbiEii/AbiGii toxin family protein [Vampirovibrionales bacterium]|nr:nucleotidyl transferase AbiEii/AbiGii toxin family protein [Vampirovibrionales bacterium]